MAHVRSSETELLAQDALVEIVTRIEQHVDRNSVVHGDIDAAHRAHLVMVGNSCDRTLIGVRDLDRDFRLVRQKRAAPSSRAERADRCQCKQRGIDRNDRALRRQIVGG